MSEGSRSASRECLDRRGECVGDLYEFVRPRARDEDAREHELRKGEGLGEPGELVLLEADLVQGEGRGLFDDVERGLVDLHAIVGAPRQRDRRSMRGSPGSSH